MSTNNLSLTWFDVFVFLVVVLTFFNQKQKIFIPECIHLLFVILANCISLHYVFRLAVFLNKFEYFLVPHKVQHIFVFITLNCVLISVGLFFRLEWLNILELKANPLLNKWGGSFVFIVRIYILLSILTLAIYFSFPKTGKKILNTSASAVYLTNTSLGIYEVFYENVLRKINPDEKKNTQVYEFIPKIPQNLTPEDRYRLN